MGTGGDTGEEKYAETDQQLEYMSVLDAGRPVCVYKMKVSDMVRLLPVEVPKVLGLVVGIVQGVAANGLLVVVVVPYEKRDQPVVTYQIAINNRTDIYYEVVPMLGQPDSPV